MVETGVNQAQAVLKKIEIADTDFDYIQTQEQPYGFIRNRQSDKKFSKSEHPDQYVHLVAFIIRYV